MNKAFVCGAHTLQSGPALNYQVKGIPEAKPCFTSSAYLAPQAGRVSPSDCALLFWDRRSSRRFELEKNNQTKRNFLSFPWLGVGLHLFALLHGHNRHGDTKKAGPP